MSVHARRFALLLIAFGTIAVSLVACQTPSSANSGSGNTVLIPTVNTSNLTPTPKFPPFTIGTWPSNFSPELNDTITIYIVCRVQDDTMQGPSHPPPAGLIINVNVGNPVGGTYSTRTGADGYAVQVINFNDPTPGQPVIVSVSTTYNNVTYHAETFFTPGPTAAPTPTAGSKGGPGGPGGGGPGPQPTVGP